LRAFEATPQSDVKFSPLGSRFDIQVNFFMTLTVSPYLTAPPSARSPQPAANGTAEGTSAPEKSAAAAADSVTLSPAAQQALGATQKTPLQSTLEAILDGVQNSTGPTLTFRAATDASTGKTLDQSC
jgi:hypothetical protein